MEQSTNRSTSKAQPPARVAEPEISPATGEPRRPWTTLVALIVAYGTNLFLGYELICSGWFSIRAVNESSRLMAWINPAVNTPVFVLSPLLWTPIYLLIMAMLGVSAHYAWNGYRYSTWASVIAASLSLLSFLLRDWTWICIITSLVVAGLLWLPKTRAYCQAQEQFRANKNYVAPILLPAQVQYGPRHR